MKRKFILRLFIVSVTMTMALFSVSLSFIEITNMVTEIKKEREGISLVKLEMTANPFIIKVPKKKESAEDVEVVLQEIVYTLKAILNKAAFINKKWYKRGDSIGEYKIGYISSSSVVLKSLNGNRTLSLDKKKKKKNFIKLNKGYK